MIVVRLSDGLGNQLFQFAASETLRARSGAAIGFLTDAFYERRANPNRPLLLPALIDCRDQLLPENSFRASWTSLLHRLLTPPDNAVRHIPGLCHLTRRAGYHPAFEWINDHMLVSGYFQARRCVADVLPAIRTKVHAGFGRRIDAARARLRAVHGDGRILALHLRLGDYQRIGDGREAIVPVERIRNALGQVDRETTILLFTDTPKVLSSLDLGRLIELYSGRDALDDFAGMIACDDFIIANSTFSWWAAALGTTPDKIVWAPADWLRPGRPGSDPNNDIYLDEHRRY
jgi:hypothetical protein